MILGLSYEEMQKYHQVFLWLPRRLQSGRWAWLEKVFRVRKVDALGELYPYGYESKKSSTSQGESE